MSQISSNIYEIIYIICKKSTKQKYIVNASIKNKFAMLSLLFYNVYSPDSKSNMQKEKHCHTSNFVKRLHDATSCAKKKKKHSRG